QAHPRVDVIVSDDGLQHLALARDIEIVVQDQRGVGNRRLLPAGPLREPASRLADVDAVVTNIGTPSASPAVSDTLEAPSQHDGRVPMVSDTRPRHIQMWLEPGLARHIGGQASQSLSAFAGQPRIAAAAGIGNPERFFTTLRAAGITLSATLSLPDHHDYATSPFQALDADVILVTAKDAIKCGALNDPRLWEVPVQAAFSDPELFDWLADLLRARKERPGRGQNGGGENPGRNPTA
ncbi:tetraacyldisaccharide 4'-kinase, partial [Achromobacter animicus]|uniref:tetraacyldisaccharide 4'-kinase n=1 Tax=Achromobacter animicus TaxID=1389935 RepID=UPI0028A6B65F